MSLNLIRVSNPSYHPFHFIDCNFRDLPSTLYNNPSTGSSIEIPTGTRLKVNCRQEYKEGNHSITCQNSGWSEVEPPCESRSHVYIYTFGFDTVDQIEDYTVPVLFYHISFKQMKFLINKNDHPSILPLPDLNLPFGKRNLKQCFMMSQFESSFSIHWHNVIVAVIACPGPF